MSTYQPKASIGRAWATRTTPPMLTLGCQPAAFREASSARAASSSVVGVSSCVAMATAPPASMASTSSLSSRIMLRAKLAMAWREISTNSARPARSFCSSIVHWLAA